MTEKNGKSIIEEMLRISKNLEAKADEPPEQTKIAELERRVENLERSLHGVNASIERRAIQAVAGHMVRGLG